ncbi:uncharacterized protein EV420DRAFT_1620503 [Desarmillaria tabescens]|uniref:RING-type domain-containing protein n=1 Tax=Armillaria tabescens TaxID=1929756 RepID=A0AA39KCP0_ARMTA|nr:uncharacterized protein EV420DRAFT_1620503 [Desarmillaria tabescens]KAK0458737.1 hypothetical protein EV420DRAFT_1620503 [Desarmillaria tabescens]
MTKHSKNNTASSIFSYAEYKKLDYGTKKQRLGNESMRTLRFLAREPLSCNEGHLFCKECVYTDLLTQKKDIKRQKEKLEMMKKEAEEEKERARQAARERVILEFEKGQLGLAAVSATGTTSAGESKEDGRGTKRKFAFDSSKIEREQAAALRNKLPDFWLPSLTPTYSSVGPPQTVKDVKLQTTCRGGNPAHSIALKNLIPVKFIFYSKTKSAGSETAGKNDESQPMCPSCKKILSNSMLMFLMKPCGHVVCKTCTESLVRPSQQCIVCDVKLSEKDVIELKREGTGFAGGGLAESSKTGVAFQG